MQKWSSKKYFCIKLDTDTRGLQLACPPPFHLLSTCVREKNCSTVLDTKLLLWTQDLQNRNEVHDRQHLSKLVAKRYASQKAFLFCFSSAYHFLSQVLSRSVYFI